MSWNQFGTYALRALKNSGVFRNDADIIAMQKYIENEYDKYLQQGLDYKWTNPDERARLVTPTLGQNNWKSKYGAINSNSNNWGNVDRSGNIDFTGQKSVGDLVDPDGSIRNYSGRSIVGLDQSTYDPEERINGRFRSITGSNDFNTGKDLSQSFGTPKEYYASLAPFELAARPVIGAIEGALGGAAIGQAAGGFANNMLGGAYNYVSGKMAGRLPGFGLERPIQWTLQNMGGQLGSRRVFNGKFGPIRPDRIGKYTSDVYKIARPIGGYADKGMLPTVSNHLHQITNGPTTSKLLERMSKLGWKGGALAGSVIGGATEGYNTISDALSGNSWLDNAYRNNNTEF